MDRKKIVSLLAGLAIFAALPAAAAVSPYLGVGFGMNSFDTNLAPVSGVSLDDSDSGARFTVGVSFNDVVSLELSRVDFGEGTLRGEAGGVFTLNGDGYVFLSNGSLREELTTWAYGLVLSLPVNRLNNTGKKDVLVPYLRAGFNSWDLDQSASFYGTTVKSGDSGTNPWFGIGCELRMTEHAGVRLGYDWYIVNDDDNVIDKVMSLGLDLVLRF